MSTPAVVHAGYSIGAGAVRQTGPVCRIPRCELELRDIVPAVDPVSCPDCTRAVMALVTSALERVTDTARHALSGVQ